MNACFSWAQSLHNLLKDPDGVKLFLRYLESEGPQYAEALHFWFACEGLKNHNQIEKIQRLVKLIYKTYFLKSALPINDDLRKQIMRNLKSPQCLEPPITLFDEAQAQIEYLIKKTTYPNFLKSDMYLQYLQSVENASSGSEDLSSESSSSSNSVSNKDLSNMASGLGPLPTLHEGMEFNICMASAPMLHTPGTSVSTGYHTPIPRLTKDMLLKSQNHRALDIRPKSETYAGLIYRSNGVHAAYNSYNPVSRQDSEMQSISSHSDARTESDNMSLNESLMDGRISGRSRHKSMEEKQARQSAARNRETNMNHAFIPRTQRVDVVDKCRPMDFNEHAALLTHKLECLKREQESQELFHRRLKENDSMSSLDETQLPTTITTQTRDLETAMREKLQFQDDNDQNILDEHVSRVFSDHSLSTSPGLASPKQIASPVRAATAATTAAQGGTPGQRWNRTRRRDKDLFSTFSGDSGNVRDFADGSSSSVMTEHKMIKSKSVPEYGEERVNNSGFVRGQSCRRSTTSKKTLAELTDSGVSVVSDSTSGLMPPSVVPVVKDSRVLTWLLESNRNNSSSSNNNGSGRSGGSGAHSEMAVGRKYGKKYGSRSNSLERNSVTGPAQPFIADPSMPPLPLPNTDIQLEEIKRRLSEDDFRTTKSRQRLSSKYYPELTQSSQSTLRKSARGGGPQQQQGGQLLMQRPILPIGGEEVTTVVFSFCDEQFPYRTKIPGTQITLRQFKEYLPKKGNYRFFFKTVCEDLSNQVTHEEVSNDGEVLPLWEGKIMAQVKPID